MKKLIILLPFMFAFTTSCQEEPELQEEAEENYIHSASYEAELPPVLDPALLNAQQARAQKVDSLLHFAQSLLGTRYCFAAASPQRGFDCSGFTWFAYRHVGVDIPRSSRTQATAGRAISLEEARPGDLLIFTGTNAKVRHPGHVGILLRKTPDQVWFIHSSSARGDAKVQIDELQGTGYEKRFLQVRRVIPTNPES